MDSFALRNFVYGLFNQFAISFLSLGDGGVCVAGSVGVQKKPAERHALAVCIAVGGFGYLALSYFH